MNYRGTQNFVLTLVFSIYFMETLAQFTHPSDLVPQNQTLHISLEKSTISIPNSDITITTRLFNGLLPGPTIRLQPGDEVKVEFSNNLADQGIMFQQNMISAPDESNLHFHGLHISGELPSDDTTHVVKPGESYNYSISLPSFHMPGTHWLHPHRHLVPSKLGVEQWQLPLSKIPRQLTQPS